MFAEEAGMIDMVVFIALLRAKGFTETQIIAAVESASDASQSVTEASRVTSHALRQRRYRERHKASQSVTGDVTRDGANIVVSKKESKQVRTVAPKRHAETRGTRVPEDFWPDAKSTATAEELGTPITPSLIDRFLDYWRGVPGAKGLKCDWQGTFRNFLDSPFNRKAQINGTQAHKPGSIEHGLAAAKAVIEEQRRREQLGDAFSRENISEIPRLRQSS